MYPKATDYDHEQGMVMPLHQQQPVPAVYGHQDQVKMTSQEPYSSTPLCCALFALFCCPYGCWCSILSLVYGLCGYADHRVGDMPLYRHRINKARCCAITAIICGLIIPMAFLGLLFLVNRAIFERFLAKMGVARGS